MKVIVYGTSHWDNEEEIDFKRESLNEWYKRVEKFIPGASNIFLTTGSYSDPNLNPLPCPLYQVPFFRPFVYSQQNCYFRTGFLTGIWKSLIDFSDFDILVHCQTRHLLGENMIPFLEEFIKRDEVVMSIHHTSNGGGIKGIDVGFMAMKKPAALLYTVSAERQTCDSNPHVIGVEEEALKMFDGLWYTPWDNIPTVRQIDWPWRTCKTAQIVNNVLCSRINNFKEDYKNSEPSPLDITDIEYFKKLPFIATSYHVTDEFLNEWKKAHPV